jgi:hypothetical protein
MKFSKKELEVMLYILERYYDDRYYEEINDVNIEKLIKRIICVTQAR